ncbi:tyrosine-type recombinase/integrase [Megasphaera sp.]|uniref:tyrosine-type recombinase/integrase n=1 Tax=Megasphaera sp. TaxID=2023260 RepID=UPI0035229815
MAYLRKRGDKWYYTLYWTDVHGKRHQSEHVGGLTKSDCQRAWRKAMASIDRTGMYRAPSSRTMAECLKEWLASIKNDYKPNTLDSYESTIRTHLIPAFGDCQLRYMTTSSIQDWLNQQRDTYSRSTVNTFYAVLKVFFRWVLLNRKYIEVDPMDHVSVPRYFTLPKRTHVFTPDEIKAIFSHFGPDDPLYMPLMLGYCCGMRLGECLALTWNHVDMRDRIVEVCATLYDKKNQPKSNIPKTSSSIRVITFGQKLYNVLKHKRWQQKEAQFRAGPFYKKTDFVCTDDSGAGLTSNNIRNFSIWCKKHFGDGSFHSLRHTHATMLIESGLGIDYVSKRLGHASVYTTANIYDSVTAKREKEAVRLMDKIL